jgi:tRNA-dihydrouridine synthase
MINIFLRIRQNTCSSKVELIPFFDSIHLPIEIKLIINIIQQKQICVIDQPTEADLSEIALQVYTTEEILVSALNANSICVFLSQEKSIDFFFQNERVSNVYIIRHEGDFTINGLEIPCDCNHCLLQSLFKDKTKLSFFQSSKVAYYDGNQYTVLAYRQLANALTNQVPRTGCKNTPPLLRSVSYPSMSVSKRVDHGEKAYKAYHALGSPKYFCAPMIGQSELAWRMFVREQGGAHIAYTQMMVSSLFIENKEYQEELFLTCERDKPLAVQFAANDPKVLVKAAKQVEPYCDAVDINFGCPQPIGRRNYYGAWLMEDWNLIDTLIKTLKENLKIPVWCKIRIFEDVETTVNYAKMIEQAGCSLLTVHGRLRQCSMNNEPANLDRIRAIKEALYIPVVANGGITSLEEANHCLEFTTCDGVMAASAILKNPFLFSSVQKTPKEMALLYLEYAEEYGALFRYIKPHVMQILNDYVDETIEKLIKSCTSITALEKIIHNAQFYQKKKVTESSTFNVLFEHTDIR